jgi:hypothetical protein
MGSELIDSPVFALTQPSGLNSWLQEASTRHVDTKVIAFLIVTSMFPGCADWRCACKMPDRIVFCMHRKAALAAGIIGAHRIQN